MKENACVFPDDKQEAEYLPQDAKCLPYIQDTNFIVTMSGEFLGLCRDRFLQFKVPI